MAWCGQKYACRNKIFSGCMQNFNTIQTRKMFLKKHVCAPLVLCLCSTCTVCSWSTRSLCLACTECLCSTCARLILCAWSVQCVCAWPIPSVCASSVPSLFLSWQNTSFVARKVCLSRWNCHDKTCVMTYLCHDKRRFAATKYGCRDTIMSQNIFVATNVVLSRHTFVVKILVAVPANDILATNT